MDLRHRPPKEPPKSSLPPELIALWSHKGGLREFRDDDRLYVISEELSYELTDGGMTMILAGDRFVRLYGDPTAVPGVWRLEDLPSDELNLREDGTYTYHWPGYEYFGEYTLGSTTRLTMREMRAVLSEADGILTFHPPYSPSQSGPWALSEPNLTISLPSGDAVYTRVT